MTSTEGRGNDLAEVDVEPVGEHEHVAVFEVVANGALVDDLLRLVGHDHHDHVCHGRCGIGRQHLEAGRGRTIPGGRAGSLGHHHLDAAVPEVLRMRVPLAAEADDGHRLAVEKTRVGVFFVQHPSLYLLCWYVIAG